RNGEVLSETMAVYCAERSTREGLEAFRSAGLPCAPVLDLAEVLADPEIQSGGLWTRKYLVVGEEARMFFTSPVRLSRTPVTIVTVTYTVLNIKLGYDMLPLSPTILYIVMK